MVAAASDACASSDTYDRLLRILTRRPAVMTAEHHQCLGGTHTRLDDGGRLCWAPFDVPPGWRYAVDAERLHRTPPPTLSARAGDPTPDRFWWLWTRAEARAKVCDVPILEWLRRADWQRDRGLRPDLGDVSDGIPPGGRERVVRVLTVATEEMVVSYALASSSMTRRPGG